MAGSNPCIVFVPGFWEGPSVFSAVINILQGAPHNYECHAVKLPSTGSISAHSGNTTSSKSPTMHDDAAAVRAVVAPLVQERHQDVVLVVHSGGGFLGTMAVEGLVKTQENAGRGGVVGVVGLSAAFWPVGHDHSGPLPFGDYTDGKMTPKDPRQLLFNDIASDEEAAKHIANLQPQPADGWGGIIGYAAWQEVPSVYLHCENDVCVIPAWQDMFAKNAGSKVVKCDAGHMMMLSQPETVARVVAEACEEFVSKI